jgi:hypothetical protein
MYWTSLGTDFKLLSDSDVTNIEAHIAGCRWCQIERDERQRQFAKEGLSEKLDRLLASNPDTHDIDVIEANSTVDGGQSTTSGILTTGLPIPHAGPVIASERLGNLRFDIQRSGDISVPRQLAIDFNSQQFIGEWLSIEWGRGPEEHVTGSSTWIVPHLESFYFSPVIQIELRISVNAIIVILFIRPAKPEQQANDRIQPLVTFVVDSTLASGIGQIQYEDGESKHVVTLIMPRIEEKEGPAGIEVRTYQWSEASLILRMVDPTHRPMPKKSKHAGRKKRKRDRST